MTSAKIDKIDLRILEELQQDSGRPIHELAKLAGISMPACARRIKRMEQAGIILRYVALLNPESLKLDLDVFVKIRLNEQTLKTMYEFRKILSTMPEVVECYAMLGDSDFLLHVRTPGVKEYNQWMQEKLIRLSNMGTTQSDVALECVKYSTALPLASSSAVTSTSPKRAKKRQRAA